MTGLEKYLPWCGCGLQQCQEVDGILVLPFSAFGRELWQKSLTRPNRQRSGICAEILTQARHGFFLVRGPESQAIAVRRSQLEEVRAPY